MASLAFHRNVKRNRPDHDLDSDLDNEPFLTNDSWPRIVAVSSASEEKPLSKLTPFAPRHRERLTRCDPDRNSRDLKELRYYRI